MSRDGRVYEPVMTALLVEGEGSTIEIRSPYVGLWRNAPDEGALVFPGSGIGEIEVLGVMHRLVAPKEAHGLVVGRDVDRARMAVGYGDRLLVLDTDAATAATALDEKAVDEARAAGSATVFRAPTSGRFYSAPAPGKPPFVEVGDEITVGRTICLLEVMKTFNRVVYGGEDVPERARIVAILPNNDDDLNVGDVILELEPL
jgi:acetyl-CoA carboxylase biotin carboxyl carrier protein